MKTLLHEWPAVLLVCVLINLVCIVAAVHQWRRLDRLDREQQARMSRPLLEREDEQ